MTEPLDDGPPDGLTPTELHMWNAFRNGSTYDLSDTDPLLNDPFSPCPGVPSAASGRRSWPACC